MRGTRKCVPLFGVNAEKLLFDGAGKMICAASRKRGCAHRPPFGPDLSGRVCADNSNVTHIDNVTDRCYVIAMSNVTHKCEECSEPMIGRIDRKYCSAACRQKAYRKSQGVATTNKVTAEPFELDTNNVFYRNSDPVRQAFYQLSEIQYLSLQEDDEGPVMTMAYPPRTKARADQDLKRDLMFLDEFLDGYDKIAENLARLRATAEAILKFHEATSSNVTDASIQQPATFGDEIKQIVRDANAEAARLRSETP